MVDNTGEIRKLKCVKPKNEALISIRISSLVLVIFKRENNHRQQSNTYAANLYGKCISWKLQF